MMFGERVLVVGPAWVGDMVMAQSLFKLLRAQDVRVQIAVLAPDWSLPLLERMPEVSETVRLPLAHGSLNLRLRWQVGRSLEGRFDRAIVLPRSLKAALVPFFARIPQRTGYRGEYRYRVLNDIRRLDKAGLPRVVDRYCNLGLARGDTLLPEQVAEPRLRVDPQGRAAARRDLGLDTSRPVVAMMPGAEYGPSKRWPEEYYAELARSLVAQGFQVWLFGSERDQPVTGAIAIAAGNGVVDLAGRTSLPQVIDLLSLASAAVTNDSGLMHIAAAVGIPLVALYGSTSPHYTPPLTNRAVVLYRAEACSPCFQRTCPKGNPICLENITPREALEAIEELLE